MQISKVINKTKLNTIVFIVMCINAALSVKLAPC